MKSFAPIVLFTYNRPQHTKALLDSLASNCEAANSTLYVFSDGPKELSTEAELERIAQVRRLIEIESRFGEVKLIKQTVNKGLAKSIIEGVTDVVDHHGKVIVLEDDLVVSPYFLYYMNDSLERYENNMKVAQIGACNFFACGSKFPDTFFIPIPDCLGWATWASRWKYFNSDSKELLDEITRRSLEYEFNVYGSYDMLSMLKDQIDGKGTSWAVRWTAVCVLRGWLTLYPNPSFSNHVESSEATNANLNIKPPLCLSKPRLSTVETEEIPRVITAMKRGYAGNSNYYGNLTMDYYLKITRWKKLKNFLSRLFLR